MDAPQPPAGPAGPDVVRILPNLRDLAASSGLGPKMKSGMLYRSARHFARSLSTLMPAVCDQLQIRTIIDLRDDNLSPSPSELYSRTLIMRLFALQMPLPVRPKTMSPPPSSVARQTRDQSLPLIETQAEIPVKVTTVDIEPGRRRLSAVPKETTPQRSRISGRSQSFAVPFPLVPTGTTITPRAGLSHPQSEPSLRRHQEGAGHQFVDATPTYMANYLEPLSLALQQRQQWAERKQRDKESQAAETGATVATSTTPAGPPELTTTHAPSRNGMRMVQRRRTRQSLGSALALERQMRKLYIINVLDTPAVKDKIKTTVIGSYTLPLLLMYKIADKLTGTALAPYYFCKYFVSMHSLLESYEEMLQCCGEKLAQALKLITVTQPPILFHCTLGKDRTGILAILVLSILGASDEAIVADYALTEYATSEAFREFAYDFIVNQSGLPESFAGAVPDTAIQTLRFLRRNWGTVDGYLDWIGFDKVWRVNMRQKFLETDHHH